MALFTFKTVQAFVQFLWAWRIGGGELVDQNTANQRAAICAQCHNNRSSSGGRVCGVCNKMAHGVLDGIRSGIIKNAKTTSDDKLQTCLVCGCDLKISVWIPNQVLLKLEDHNAYPTFCFKKKIVENLEV